MSTRSRPSPSSPSTTPTTPTTPLSGRVVRRNGLEALRRSLAETSRASRIILAVSLFIFFSQVIITAVILSGTAQKSCDWRVRFYLIAYAIRSILLAPLVVQKNLRPSATRANRRNSGNTSSSPPGALEEGRQAPSSPESTDATVQAGQTAFERTPFATPDINMKVDRAKSFLDFLGTFLFVIGNFILFDRRPEMCAQTAPALYYLMVAWIAFDYIAILIPVILCGAIIFCLPWVLVIMRVFRIGQAAGMGAEEGEIQKLPTVIYRAPGSVAQPGAHPTATSPDGGFSTDSLSPSEEGGDSTPLRRPKRRWWKSWRVFNPFRKSKKSMTGIDHLSSLKENELTLEEDDAVCVICLAEYEDGVELRKLLCEHHFHTGCVDEWLRINRSCPLCKRDINVVPITTEQNESDTSAEEGGSNRNTSLMDAVPSAVEDHNRGLSTHDGLSTTNVWSRRSSEQST